MTPKKFETPEYNIKEWSDCFTVQKKVGLFFHAIKTGTGSLRKFKTKKDAQSFIRQDIDVDRAKHFQLNRRISECRSTT